MSNTLTKIKQPIKSAVIWLILISISVYISSRNYLLFHSSVELIGVIIAYTIISISSNTYRISRNNYITFLSISYGFVAGFDLLHMLAYKGMGVFGSNTANLATQMWIIARYMEAISLIVSFVFFYRKVSTFITLLIYSTCSVLLLLSVFYWDVFPDCFIDNSGLTSFKIISEYIIMAMLIAGIVLLRMTKSRFNHDVYIFMVLFFIVKIFSEFSFTLYTNVYGIPNLAGHIFKLISLYFIYKAMVLVNLKTPFKFLFSELKAANEQLQKDIVKRKAIENSLREEKDMLKEYLSVSNIIFLVLSPEQKVILINKKGCEILGLEENDIIGKNWFDNFIPEKIRDKGYFFRHNYRQYCPV